MLGRLRSLFERKAAIDLSALIDAANVTAAGIATSPTRALMCTPVYVAVRVVAETIGSLPCHLYRRLPNGGKERATDHPLAKLIHDWPNEWTPAAKMFMELAKDACVHEVGGVALANRSGDRIVELIRLPATSVLLETDNSLEPRYKVTLKSGEQKTYPWQDILHFESIDGLAPVKQAREAIGLYMVLERHAAQLFNKGARPAGVLKHKNKISDPVYERLKKSWSGSHSGEGAGGTAILEDGVEFEALTFKSTDAQFAELRQYQLTEIARAFRVPPTLLQDFGRATWANAAEMSQSFLTYCIMPQLKLYQGAIARLLSSDDREKYIVEFLVDDLVKADIAARFAAYAQAVTNGILNPNEVRAMENRPSYAGGDEFMKPLNMGAPGNAPPAPLPKPRAVT